MKKMKNMKYGFAPCELCRGKVRFFMPNGVDPTFVEHRGYKFEQPHMIEIGYFQKIRSNRRSNQDVETGVS
ncbi:MAG TPA: hypothetical protein PLN89_10400 [Elusimicrobiota bacterium]|nr:hypothetical protein [Elusimicrobiota bacterium]